MIDEETGIFPQRRESKTCQVTGKRIYSSKQQAREGTRFMGNRCRCYECPHCKGWHVTKRMGHR